MECLAPDKRMGGIEDKEQDEASASAIQWFERAPAKSLGVTLMISLKNTALVML